MAKVQQATTQQQLEAILQLRYVTLRKPWNKPADSATDELEPVSVNAFISDEHGKVIACGRLHKIDELTGQIRFMAVDEAQQGKGLGKQVCAFLEAHARGMGLKKIQLQARENALEFYRKAGYSVTERTFLLWDTIQHYLMEKELH